MTAAVVVVAARLAAEPVSIVESGAAQIAPRLETFAAPNYSSNLNAGTGLNTFQGMNVAGGTPLAYMILWNFDLSAYAGQVFTGNVTISCGQNWGENGPLNFRLYTVVTNWHESTVTWENFLGPETTNNMGYTAYPGNNQAYTNVLGTELALTACTGTGTPSGGTNFWTFAGSNINYMLAQPSRNFGIALVPDWNANMMWCTRHRNWDASALARRPTLHATIVPDSSEPQGVLTNQFRVRNEVRMPNVPRLALNIAGYAKYSSLTMRELMPLGNFEPLLHGSLHFASGTASTPAKWVTGSGPSMSGMDLRGYRLEILTGTGAGQWALITNATGGNTYALDRALPQPANNDAFAIRGVSSNFYRDYYVATNVFSSLDVRPGADGVMCVRFAPGGELTYLMDNHTTPSYIVFTGTYVMSFWGKAAVAGQSVQILAARWNWGAQYLFNQTISLGTEWRWYSVTNTVTTDPNGTNFRVMLRRTGSSGDVLIDDWSLQKILPVSHSAYTREAEDAITNLLTWCGRHWMGELGDTLDNFIAPRGGQMPTEDRVWGSGYYPTMPEFMQMCQQLGLSGAWFALPPILSTNEGMKLIEFLAGPTNTPYGALRAQRGRVAPWTDDLIVYLELGNEVWHYQNGPPYAKMITQLYGAMRQSPWFDADRMPLVMGGQAGNNWRADNSVPQAKYYDSYNNAGYTLGNYSDTNTADTFGPLMAFHDYQYNNQFGYQRDLLINDGRGKSFSIYEVNMHTTGGTAPADIRNQAVTSAGAAVAGFDALLTHYYQSRMPCINVFAMMGNGFNYGGGVVKLWGIYASLEMGQMKRPYYYSMLGANRAIGNGAHLLVTEEAGTPARWTQTLKNGVSGTFPYMKCYGLMDGPVYRVVLVNRDWLSNRIASVSLPFSYNGSVPYLQFRPDNGSPWNTVESLSFNGWAQGAVAMSGSNLAVTVPACSFNIFTITNAGATTYTLQAGRVGRGNYDRNPSGRYVAGTALGTTVYPDDDESFHGWTGAVTGETRQIALLMTDNMEITAWFQPIPEPAWLAVCAGMAAWLARRRHT